VTNVDTLTENDVVEIVCGFLCSAGYEIEQRLTTTQTGDDIIAVRHLHPLRRVHIEAKGATSARVGSQRYGQPFDSAQVRVHVAEAVYKAAQVLSRPAVDYERLAAVALPDNETHRLQVESVHVVLRQLGIAVVWVAGEAEVSFESEWAL